MANKISDETIGIRWYSWQNWNSSGQEKEDAKADMEKNVRLYRCLNELDTDGIEPMSHVFPVKNVFRGRCRGQMETAVRRHSVNTQWKKHRASKYQRQSDRRKTVHGYYKSYSSRGLERRSKQKKYLL